MIAFNDITVNRVKAVEDEMGGSSVQQAFISISAIFWLYSDFIFSFSLTCFKPQPI